MHECNAVASPSLELEDGSSCKLASAQRPALRSPFRESPEQNMHDSCPDATFPFQRLPYELQVQVARYALTSDRPIFITLTLANHFQHHHHFPVHRPRRTAGFAPQAPAPWPSCADGDSNGNNRAKRPAKALTSPSSAIPPPPLFTKPKMAHLSRAFYEAAFNYVYVDRCFEFASRSAFNAFARRIGPGRASMVRAVGLALSPVPIAVDSTHGGSHHDVGPPMRIYPGLTAAFPRLETLTLVMPAYLRTARTDIAHELAALCVRARRLRCVAVQPAPLSAGGEESHRWARDLIDRCNEWLERRWRRRCRRRCSSRAHERPRPYRSLADPVDESAPWLWDPEPTLVTPVLPSSADPAPAFVTPSGMLDSHIPHTHFPSNTWVQSGMLPWEHASYSPFASHFTPTLQISPPAMDTPANGSQPVTQNMTLPSNNHLSNMLRSTIEVAETMLDSGSDSGLESSSVAHDGAASPCPGPSFAGNMDSDSNLQTSSSERAEEASDPDDMHMTLPRLHAYRASTEPGDVGAPLPSTPQSDPAVPPPLDSEPPTPGLPRGLQEAVFKAEGVEDYTAEGADSMDGDVEMAMTPIGDADADANALTHASDGKATACTTKYASDVVRVSGAVDAKTAALAVVAAAASGSTPKISRRVRPSRRLRDAPSHPPFRVAKPCNARRAT